MSPEPRAVARASGLWLRYVVVGAALTFTLTGALAGQNPAQAAASPSAPLQGGSEVSACTGARLVVTQGTWSAAADDVAVAIEFRNAGTLPCRTTGYPAVSVLNAAGHVIAHAVPSLRGYMGGYGGTLGSKPPVVVIQPRGTASALVEATGIPSPQLPPSSQRCRYLLVTPPDGTRAVRLDVEQHFVGFWRFQVHPVLAGTSGRTSS